MLQISESTLQLVLEETPKAESFADYRDFYAAARKLGFEVRVADAIHDILSERKLGAAGNG